MHITVVTPTAATAHGLALARARLSTLMVPPTTAATARLLPALELDLVHALELRFIM